MAASGSVNVMNIGATTPLSALVVDPAGITLSGSTYHTSGDQTYSAPVLLGGNETITSDTGNISFAGAINGAFGLSLFASSGTVGLSDVGTSIALTSLLVAPTSIVLDGTTYHTIADQIYSSPITLGANATLTSNTGDVQARSCTVGERKGSLASVRQQLAKSPAAAAACAAQSGEKGSTPAALQT